MLKVIDEALQQNFESVKACVALLSSGSLPVVVSSSYILSHPSFLLFFDSLAALGERCGVEENQR